MISAQCVASSSTKILIHDVARAKSNNYNTATSGGTGIQPTVVFPWTNSQQSQKINALAWSHNNQIVASGGDDGAIVLSSSANGKKVHTFQANANPIISGGSQYTLSNTSVNSLVFSKNSEFLCAGLGDGQTKIWNL